MPGVMLVSGHVWSRDLQIKSCWVNPSLQREVSLGTLFRDAGA